jgi:hypothetical protein
LSHYAKYTEKFKRNEYYELRWYVLCSVDLRLDLDEVGGVLSVVIMNYLFLGVRLVLAHSEVEASVVHLGLQKMQFFVLNDQFSEVMSVVEQILNWDWVEPLARGHVAGEETAEDRDTKGDTKTCELVACLLIGCAL